MQLGPTIISEGNRRHEKSMQRQSHGLKTLLKGTEHNEIEPDLKRRTPVTTSEPHRTGNEAVSNDTASSDSSASDSSSVGQSEPDVSPKENKSMDIKRTAKSSTVQPPLRPPKTLGVTLFDRLESMYGGKVKRMLNVQYRCVILFHEEGVLRFNISSQPQSKE